MRLTTITAAAAALLGVGLINTAVAGYEEDVQTVDAWARAELRAHFAAQPALQQWRCLVESKGSTWIDGACSIAESKGGTFTVLYPGENNVLNIIAGVLVIDGDKGLAFVSAKYSDGEDNKIGVVTRDGDNCWVNSVGKVCAWIGEAR